MAEDIISLDATIDLSNWSSAINQMIGDAAKIDGLFGSPIDVKLTADTSDLEFAQRVIADIKGESATITINTVDTELINAQTLISKLDSDGASVDIDATYSELTNAQQLINRIDGESATIPIKAETSDADSDIARIKEDLNTLQSLAKLDILLNLPGNISDLTALVTSIPLLGGAVGMLTDVDQAVTSIERRTGESIAGLDGLVSTIQTETGASFEEISGFVTEMVRSGETDLGNLETAAVGTFRLVRDEGVGAAETLLAANRLVQTGLAEDLPQAFDVLAYGFETNVNRAGDYYDLIGEFGGDFARLGLDGKEMVDLTNASLDAGAQNAGRYGEAINSFSQNIEGANVETATLLDNLNLDPNKLGIGGLQTVIEHVQSLTDETERAAAMAATFGSGGTEIGEGQVFALPDEAEMSTSIETWATEAGTAVELSVTESLDLAARSFQGAMVTALDEAFNISGFLDTLKNAAVTFSSEIKAGSTIGEAIEVSLGLEENSIARLESVVGNFVISAAEFLAGAIDLLGGDSSGVRAGIAEASETQLAFDIQLAEDPEDIAHAFETAISRGVSSPDAQAAVSQAVDEMLAAGDIAGAREVVENLGNVVDTGAIRDGLSSAGSQIIEGTQNTEHAIERLETAAAGFATLDPAKSAALTADAELLRAAPTVDTTGLQTQVDTFVADLHSGLTTAINSKDWSGALDIANKLGLDNAAQLVGDLHLSSQLQAVEVPAQVTFDPAMFDQSMAGMTDQILVELNGAESQLTEKQVTVSNVSMRIVDDVQGAESDVTATLPTFTAAATTITGSGVEVSGVSMRIVDDSATMATATTDASVEMDTSFAAISTSATTYIPGAQTVIMGMISAIGGALPGLTAQLLGFVAALGDFDTVGTKALEVSAAGVSQGGTGKSGPQANSSNQIGHAEGGVKDGWGWVGEDGPELMHTDSRVAILNNKTSTSLVSGLNSMFGGGMGGGQTANTYHINNTFNVPNLAVGLSSGQQVANAVRGF